MIFLRKMFNVYVLLLFAVLLQTPSAMAAMGDTWSMYYYGGVGAGSLSKTSDGSYLIASADNYRSSYNSDFWITKLNEQGSIALNILYGGSYGDGASTIKQTADGGYIVAGTSESFGGGLAIKTDSSGNLLWNKVYGGIYDGFVSIEQTSDSGYIYLFRNASLLSSGLAKVNLNGDVEWYKIFDGAELSKFVQTQDGGYLLIGTTRVYGAGMSDGIVIRTNSLGDMVWQKTYGGQNDDSISSVISLPGGGFVLAGSTSSFGNGDSDLWIFNIDTNGNITSQKTYGTTKNEWCNSLIRTSDGGLALAGYDYTPKGYYNGQEFEQYDALVTKLDSTGNFLWQKTYGVDYRFDKAINIVESSSGGFIVSGQAFPSTESVAWVFKTDQSGNIFGCRANRFYINVIQMQQHDINITTTSPSIIATQANLPSSTATGLIVQSLGTGGSGNAQCVQDAPQIYSDTTSLSFGDVILGNSAPQNLTITNIGNSDLSITDSFIYWTNASEFSHANNCSTLAPNNSCLIQVQFNPTSPGSKVAALSLATNDPFYISYTKNLYGTGVIDNDNDNYPVAVDCNDNNPTVHPDASETKNDGIDQDCNGYDLTINIPVATYKSSQDKLTVEATSTLGAAADLQLVGYGSMAYSSQQNKWTKIIQPANGNPVTVTVSGIEGSDTATVR